MLRIEQVLGSRLDPALAERIHELEHQGAVDLLTVPVADVARHRLRATTQGGTEVAIALRRDQHLFDGAVLVLADRYRQGVPDCGSPLGRDPYSVEPTFMYIPYEV